MYMSKIFCIIIIIIKIITKTTIILPIIELKIRKLYQIKTYL